jgi:hypothetical protein
MDLGIEVIQAFFSKEGLRKSFISAGNKINACSGNALRIFSLQENYMQTIEVGPKLKRTFYFDPLFTPTMRDELRTCGLLIL